MHDSVTTAIMERSVVFQQNNAFLKFGLLKVFNHSQSIIRSDRYVGGNLSTLFVGKTPNKDNIMSFESSACVQSAE